MTGFGDMIAASEIAESVSNIRFDRAITGFEFKPSLGIVAKDIDRFGIDIRSMREPLTRAVRDVMVPSIRTNFDVGGRPKWDPLAESTVVKRNFQAVPILIRKGTLRRAVTTISVWTITQVAATIKDIPDRAWYGKVHQAGHEGSSTNAGKWFAPYQKKAAEVLGPGASKKEINDFAFKIFDKRQQKHGPAPRGSAEIPARPFALFQEEDLDDIQDIFGDWLEERARKVGRFT
jgi:phage gpG-like protein